MALHGLQVQHMLPALFLHRIRLLDTSLPLWARPRLSRLIVILPPVGSVRLKRSATRGCPVRGFFISQQLLLEALSQLSFFRFVACCFGVLPDRLQTSTAH